MKNTDSFLVRIKQAFKLLLGKANLEKKDELRNNIIWLKFKEDNDTIIEINQKAEDTLGNSKNLYKKKFSEFIHSEDLALRQNFYYNSLEEATSNIHNNYLSDTICYRVLLRDGQYHWIAETGLFSTDKDGDRIYISFLVEVEQEHIDKLEQNHKRYENDLKGYVQFCENMQSAIIVLDKDRIIAGNTASYKLYEVASNDELKGMSLYDIMEVTKDAVASLTKRALAGYIRNLYFDYLQIDGTRIDIAAYVYPMPHLNHLILIYKIVSRETADMSKANKMLHSRLFEDNPVAMTIVDPINNLIHTANLAARKLYKYDDNSMRDLPLEKITNSTFDSYIEDMLKQGYIQINEQEHKNINGESFYVDIFAFPYKIKEKQMICCSISNVSDRVKSKEQVQKLGIALENSPNFIVIANKQLEAEYVNNTFLNRSGLKKEEVLGKHISQLAADNVQEIHEFLSSTLTKGDIKSGDILCKGYNDKKNFWVNIISAPIKYYNDEIIGMVLTGEDLTLKNSYNTQINKLKLYDTMTGLANRQYIFNKLEEYFRNSKTKASLSVIDLDKLSSINETLGLSSGDIIIKITADRLKKHLSANDILARLGNDEFALLHILDDKDDGTYIEEHIKNLQENIISSFKEAIIVKKHKLVCNISIGTVLLPNDAKDSENALRYAELAMYQAKEIKGKSSYYQFSKNLLQTVNKRFKLEQGLKKALKLKQFVLYYQAKINLNTNKIYGFEALLRWIDQDNNIVSPLDFIPIAEETGLILPISDWVLEEACKQSVIWERENKQAKIAVNISPRQFQETNFIQKVKETLDKTGVNPNNIELEITEGMLIKDMKQALYLLHQLKALGVTLAIDDFGTGYSSFAYIKEMPVDVLKVDKAFIDNLPSNKKDCAIAHTIITLAKELNMLVVAEGIEANEQAEFLQKNSCDYAQGYFYAKPLEVNQIETLFDKK